jgi:hypothetical protein
MKKHIHRKTAYGKIGRWATNIWIGIPTNTSPTMTHPRKEDGTFNRFYKESFTDKHDGFTSEEIRTIILMMKQDIEVMESILEEEESQ